MRGAGSGLAMLDVLLLYVLDPVLMLFLNFSP